MRRMQCLESFTAGICESGIQKQSTEAGTVGFAGKPEDIISQSVAKALYGEVSPYSATRLERFAACAFAHFLQYGMKLTERGI